MPAPMRRSANNSTTAPANVSTTFLARGANRAVTSSNRKCARCATASEAPSRDIQMKQKRDTSSLQGFG